MSQIACLSKIIPISSSKLTHRPRRPELPLLRSSVPCNCMGIGGGASRQPETKLSHSTKREREVHVAGATTAIPVTTTQSEATPLTTTQSEEVSTLKKLFLSDIVVKKRKTSYFFRKWTVDDVATSIMIGAPHILAVIYPFVFTWTSLWVGITYGFLTGFGVTLSYHRHLSHRSFKLKKWVEYFFAYCGALALQKDPIFWVSTHRKHHIYTDTLRDPHSPIEGFWFSHIGWLFDTDYMDEKFGRVGYDNVADLQKQPFYRFLNKTYYAHLLMFAALLYAVGGLPFLAGAMGVSRVITLHSTFLATSACHIWGNRPWNTPDNSTNNWWVAVYTLGEGWHNNHHAFPYSARHGLEWWQYDLTWYLIKGLEALGLASDIKLPTEEHKLARANITSTDNQAQTPLVRPFKEVAASSQAQSPPISLNGAMVGI